MSTETRDTTSPVLSGRISVPRQRLREKNHVGQGDGVRPHAPHPRAAGFPPGYGRAGVRSDTHPLALSR